MKKVSNFVSKCRLAALSAFVSSFVFASSAFADNPLYTAVKPGIENLVKEVTMVAGIVILVVLACVGAKVVMGMLKKS